MSAWCTGSDVIRLGESEYHLASTGSGSGDKTTSAQLVRRCISEQLQDVLGNNDENIYIAPVSGSSQLASPRIQNIGYNTLTRVVREELRRFSEASAAHGQHQRTTCDVLGTSSSSSDNKNATRSRQRATDYEEIDDVIKAISERDQMSAAVAGDDDDDDEDVVPVPRHSPPPPPPRLSASSTASATTTDASGRAVTTAVEAAVAGDSVRQRTAQVDNQRVIQLLERIEQSTAELDASFTALVNVGLRCLETGSD